MYVIFYSFVIALLLWLIESIVIAIKFRKKSWKFHIPVQLLLIVLVWPTMQLAFSVVSYIETKDIKAKNMRDLSIKWDIPKQCTNIDYHRDPTGRWFYCNINSNEALTWLSAGAFSTTEDIKCGPYDEVLSKIYLEGKQEYFNTEMEPDGAGSSAIIGDDYLFVCQWFW